MGIIFFKEMSESVHIWHNNFIDVPITIKISEYGYALGVKGQGQLFLKSVLMLETRELFFHFFEEGCSNFRWRIFIFDTLRGAFGKFLAWSFISVTDLQTLLCLISFERTLFPLCHGTNFMRIL